MNNNTERLLSDEDTERLVLTVVQRLVYRLPLLSSGTIQRCKECTDLNSARAVLETAHDEIFRRKREISENAAGIMHQAACAAIKQKSFPEWEGKAIRTTLHCLKWLIHDAEFRLEIGNQYYRETWGVAYDPEIIRTISEEIVREFGLEHSG